MYLHSLLTCKEPCFQDKIVAFFVISSCLFCVAGLGIVVYDGDFSDTNDHPVITLVSPIFFYHPHKQVTFLTFIPESTVLSLKDNLPVIIRAPPL
jgi:hypothetical protein